MESKVRSGSGALYGILIKFLIFILIFSIVTLGVRYLFHGFLERLPRLFSDTTLSEGDGVWENPKRIVVLDAGHGGEDGGTSASDGTLEKDLNLSTVFLLAEYLRAGGIEVVLTRDSDRLLYDPSSDYTGKKKLLDQRERLSITNAAAERNPNAEVVFVSIHMNSFPQSTVSGFQVWYFDHNAESRRLAASVQQSAKLFSADTKGIKSAGNHIFLLDRLEIPAILIECGFLSCPEEAARLKDETYRRKMAFAIFTAIMNYSMEASVEPPESEITDSIVPRTP